MSFLIGLVGIFYGLYYVFTFPKGGFSGYIDKPSLMLLGLLPPAIMLLSHKLTDFATGVKILFTSMFSNNNKKQYEIISALTRCSAKVRSEGVGALVNERKSVTYDLLIDGISLIINNFTTDEIRHNLQAKIKARQGKLEMASSLFENMAKVSPGVGMIGTLLGLIDMMSNIGDPSTIGSGMALALITTLYGLLLGTIFYAPFGEKIALESEKMLELDLLVMEGVLAMKGKKSSAHLKDIMKTYGSKNAGVAEGQPNKRGA